jgi:hypothetical protein
MTVGWGIESRGLHMSRLKLILVEMRRSMRDDSIREGCMEGEGGLFLLSKWIVMKNLRRERVEGLDVG